MKNRISKLVKIVFIYLFSGFLFADVNFSEHISPIIYNNCTECHRAGEIGSFLPLTNFDEVFSSKEIIAYTIAPDSALRHGEPIMPPWPPDRDYSSLVGERALTENEIHMFLEWIETDAEQGDPSLESSIPDFPEGSAIGEPDIVLTMEESVHIEGNYEDYYRCFIFDLESEDEIFYTAMEVRPGNNEAVHHTVIVAVPHGAADFLDEEDEEYGYECFGGFGINEITDLLGGYAPGTKPNKWNNGLAQSIPAGWDLVVQMHYAPVSEDMEDLSEINIFLTDEDDVDRVIESFTMIDPYIIIPPHEIVEIERTQYVSSDISVVSFFPHSHLIGQSWEVYATAPNGEVIPFIKINNWDFDWQNYYYPEYMLHIPSGSTIYATATYDNTANNPNNPNDPPEWIFWGDGTTDEMFFLPILYVPYQEGDENISLSSSLSGDVNFDSQLDVLDVVMIVNFVLGTENFSYNQIQSSDMNEDGVVDILDIVQVIQEILYLN